MAFRFCLGSDEIMAFPLRPKVKRKKKNKKKREKERKKSSGGKVLYCHSWYMYKNLLRTIRT